MTVLLMICHSFCSAKHFYKNSCFRSMKSTAIQFYKQFNFWSIFSYKFHKLHYDTRTLYNNTIMTWFTELYDSPIAIGV